MLLSLVPTDSMRKNRVAGSTKLLNPGIVMLLHSRSHTFWLQSGGFAKHMVSGPP